MQIAIFSNHKYEPELVREANRSFKHDLVFLTATLKNTTASLDSGFPAVCVFVNDRLDAPVPVLAQLARAVRSLWPCACTGFNNVDLGAAEAHGITIVRVPPTRRMPSPNSLSASWSLLIGRSAVVGCAAP